jgi:preprotein translocase subunit SecD
MRRWWDRLFVLIIAAIAAGAIYAVWPDEPDRYLPDFLNLPSGSGVPSKILGVALPCRDETPSNDSDDCKGMTLGLDLQGGQRITLEADVTTEIDDLAGAVADNKDIIEHRINPLGISESSIQQAGDDRLIVELPGVSAERARDLTRAAQLMFCEPLQRTYPAGEPTGSSADVATLPPPVDAAAPAQLIYYRPGTCEPDVDADGNVALAAVNPDGTRVLGADGRPQVARNADGLIIRVTPVYDAYTGDPTRIIWMPATGTVTDDAGNSVRVPLTGEFLDRDEIEIVQANQFGGRVLAFGTTDGEGDEILSTMTRRMVGLPLAPFFDGEPLTGTDGGIIAPNVNAELGGSGVIEGLSRSEMEDLETFLENGAFQVPMKVVQEQTIDATLGDEAVRHSVQAGIVALAIVMAFMTLYYRLPGALASIALTVYAAVVLAIFKIGIPEYGPVTLTLAGVAAFVLSVGMAVDANILIFERTKEELRNGRSLIPAVNAGFDRAWSSIRDSNIATLITCAILWWMGDTLGSAPIEGFAITLGIGVIVSLFSAISVTRTLLRLTIATPLARPMWLWTDDKLEDHRPYRERRAAAGLEATDA